MSNMCTSRAAHGSFFNLRKPFSFATLFTLMKKPPATKIKRFTAEAHVAYGGIYAALHTRSRNSQALLFPGPHFKRQKRHPFFFGKFGVLEVQQMSIQDAAETTALQAKTPGTADC